MTVVPSNAQHPGHRWRPLHADDHAAVVAVDAAVDREEHLSDPMSLQTAATFLTPPWVTPETDTICAVDETGRLVAYGAAMGSASERGNRVMSFFEALPEARSLEPALLAWCEDRARRQIAEGHPGVESMIRVSVEDHRIRRRRLLEEAGYTPARVFAEMACRLASLPPAPDIAHEFALIPWEASFDESVRQASNASFAGHWGSLPMTPEQWQGLYRDSPGFRPDLSFVALAGEEVAAMCLVETDAERDARVGFTEAWIHRLGTVPRYRRQGLGRALMITSMAAARDAGVHRAALGVDELGEAGALSLYQSLGFEVELRTIEYVVAVDPPAPRD